ncbi:MAG: hypothetical protein WC529_03955 [Candidatus Margulisiibacteriota bacterium]
MTTLARLKWSAANLYRALPRSRAELASDLDRRWQVAKQAGLKQIVIDAGVTAAHLFRLGQDIATLVLPGKAAPRYGSFAFGIHPRDLADVYRHYPFFRYLPESLTKEICRYLPPTRLSTIEGLVSPVNGKTLIGQLLTTAQTPDLMLEDGRWAAMHAVLLARLADKLGIGILGLGALLPSLTRYGTTINKHVPDLTITTGHAYTALLVAQTALKVSGLVAPNRSELIAVVGAGGSIGAAASLILGENGADRLLLIDRDMKLGKAQTTAQALTAKGVEVEVTSDLAQVSRAGIIISVTNADKMLIREELLRPGMIIIDDAQPANVSQALAARHPEIAVLKVLAKVPGLKPNFDFGLGTPPDVTFTCLAETTLLAAAGSRRNFATSNIDPAWIEFLAQIAQEQKVAPPDVFYGFNGREITSAELRDKFGRFFDAAKA